MSDTDKRPRGLFGRLFGPKPSEASPQPDPAIASEDGLDGQQDHAAAENDAEVGLSAEADAAAIGAAPEIAFEALVEAPELEPSAAAPVPVKKGWFQRLRDGLTKTSSKLSEGITGLFTKRKLDGATLEDLEDLLIQADLGIETAGRITSAISKGRFEKGISADDVRQILAAEVARVLEPVAKPLVIDSTHKPHVILTVGVNGSGKTTTLGKLSEQFRREGKSVMLAAGDTFRAAAIDQLRVWGQRTGATVIARDEGSDASGLAFDAMKEAQAAGCDVLLIDTAGRLQNKQVLMEELQKVVRVIKKIDPSAPHDVLLVLDATTGQNALSQVDVFTKIAGVTGLIMTKLDGTARGGILVAIAAKYGLPVHAIGVGEGVDDLQAFKAADFAAAIADT
jgi:fused signal recognition particle receptor